MSNPRELEKMKRFIFENNNFKEKEIKSEVLLFMVDQDK